MNMEAKLWFMVLCGLAVLLSYLAGFWRRKTAAAAFVAEAVNKIKELTK